MVLLIAIAYTTATMQGRKIKLMGIQKYIGRLKEQGEMTAQQLLYWFVWSNLGQFVEQCADVVAS